jgi:hypothetical protein
MKDENLSNNHPVLFRKLPQSHSYRLKNKKKGVYHAMPIWYCKRCVGWHASWTPPCCRCKEKIEDIRDSNFLEYGDSRDNFLCGKCMVEMRQELIIFEAIRAPAKYYCWSDFIIFGDYRLHKEMYPMEGERLLHGDPERYY